MVLIEDTGAFSEGSTPELFGQLLPAYGVIALA